MAATESSLDFAVAAFIFQTSTAFLPNSYIVFSNGAMFAVHAWLDESKRETHDRSEVCYAVFMDGPHEVTYNLDPYTFAHPSWENH